MTEPGEYILGAVDLCPVWNGRAVYHQHRQAELSRGEQLGLSALPAGVLAHDQVDGMDLHQAAVPCDCEGTTIHDQALAGQSGRAFRSIDEAQQIMVLRLGGEGFHMHPSQREHDVAGWPAQRSDRTVNVWNMRPMVTGDRLPGRTGQRDMGDAGQPSSVHGMRAHRRGKGVCRVNQMRHAMMAQIVGQSRNAAEASDTHRHRLSTGSLRAAGIAERRRNALCREQSGESVRLGCAAQQEDMSHG